jgi:EAL domain-containing protein (putative c-di-GMP-specific phosphodiesterase class I)
MNVYDIFKADTIYHDYQPLYTLASRKRLFAYEALLRNAAQINPEDVFKSATKANVLYKLDTCSLQKAITSYFKKQSTGYLFLNIYLTTILHPNFMLFFDSMCKLFPELPKRLYLELNETSTEELWQLPHLKRTIQTLRDYGVFFAIDDFGQGTASIKRAIEFGAECIKLDRYFTQNLANDEKKQRFVELFISFYGKDTLVVLEGIERKEELIVAKQLGIHAGQGYYLGRPTMIENVK